MAKTGPLSAAITMLVVGSDISAGCGSPPDESSVAAQGYDAQALEVGAGAGAPRPRDVPREFVLTPHGYFHPSCVVELRDDEKVREDGSIERFDGARRPLRHCQFSRYDKHGRVVSGQAPPPPSVNGWVASASSASFGPVDWISASWAVPGAPASAGSQTLYMFPGLEPAATGDTILQPVLAWNGFNDGRWTLASWNCCKNGNALHSTPVPVTPGDTVSGYVSGKNCNSQGVCAQWEVQAAASSGLATTLSTDSYGEVLDWAFGGAFESYGIDSCAQYPADGAVSFQSIAVHQVNGAYVNPTWSPAAYGVSPNCLTGVDATSVPHAVSMTWWPASNSPPPPPSQCGYLRANEGLVPGRSLSSCDGRFSLSVRPSDGNLVLSQSGVGSIWSASSPSGYSAVMQADGSFAVYSRTSRVWATNTSGRTGAYLALRNDGNLVLYSATGKRLWASNTCCR